MRIDWPLDWPLQPDWPLLTSITLVLIKQFYKLFVYHKPDKVDFIKALVTLPLDMIFLVVGLIIKAAMSPKPFDQSMIFFTFIYLILGLLSTALWRKCEAEAKNGIGAIFGWAFPFNSALSGATFYLAIEILK